MNKLIQIIMEEDGEAIQFGMGADIESALAAIHNDIATDFMDAAANDPITPFHLYIKDIPNRFTTIDDAMVWAANCEWEFVLKANFR